MGNWKEIAKTAGIALGVVFAYHNGYLSFVPTFKNAPTPAGNK